MTQESLQRALEPGVRWLLALDDWHPNYGPDRMRVKAQLRCLPTGYRVIVSGADDFALVKDNLTENEAKYLLERLPPLITKQAAYDLGFLPF